METIIKLVLVKNIFLKFVLFLCISIGIIIKYNLCLNLVVYSAETYVCKDSLGGYKLNDEHNQPINWLLPNPLTDFSKWGFLPLRILDFVLNQYTEIFGK